MDHHDLTTDHTKVDSERPARSTLGALIDALDERAFGLMLLILALPCCLPFLYGIPQIVALPMLALTAQLAMGRTDPWLPQKLQQRSFDIEGMRGVVRRAKRYLGWFEAIARPRLSFLTEGLAVRIVGALLLIPTASILSPGPPDQHHPRNRSGHCGGGIDRAGWGLGPIGSIDRPYLGERSVRRHHHLWARRH